MTNFCSVAKLISMTLHDLQHFSLAWQRRGAKSHNTEEKQKGIRCYPRWSLPVCVLSYLHFRPFQVCLSSRYFFKARKQSIHKIIRLCGYVCFPHSNNSQSQPGCHIFSIQHCTHRVSRIDHSNGLGNFSWIRWLQLLNLILLLEGLCLFQWSPKKKRSTGTRHLSLRLRFKSLQIPK